MITIITGVPGMGKTAYVVAEMLKEQAKDDPRPFFVMGIPELTLDHSPVPPVLEWTEQRPDKDDPSVMLPYFTFPPNSIIVIDEAQRVFRPRASGSKVPDHVAAQETHRHTGVDFWLMTQKPSLIDANIRDLCGRHIHLKNGLLGRFLYEWNEYTDVRNKANYADAARRKFSPPKKAFKCYKSSEMHTKQPRRIHQAFYLLAAVFAFTAYNGYGVYEKFTSKVNPEAAQLAESSTAQPDVLEKINVTKPELVPASLQPEPERMPAQQAMHPFSGYTFYIKGIMTARGEDVAYFDLKSPDGRNTFMSSAQLQELGYEMKVADRCSAFLFFSGASIVATCAPRSEQSGLTGALGRARLAAPGDGAAPHVDYSESL